MKTFLLVAAGFFLMGMSLENRDIQQCALCISGAVMLGCAGIMHAIENKE